MYKLFDFELINEMVEHDVIKKFIYFLLGTYIYIYIYIYIIKQ